MGRKANKRHWLERDYKAFMKTKEGKKLIDIARILAYGMSNIAELKSRLGCSRSEIRKLLKLGEEHEWIHSYSVTKTSRFPGRPRAIKSENKTGRPSVFYTLAAKGLFYMRSDPELIDEWKTVEENYGKLEGLGMLNSFDNLRYAIHKHPVLSKFKSPDYFDGILQRKILNPFLFKRYPDDIEFDHIVDELVKLFRENVRPEYIRPYRTSLQDSVSRLRKITKRHKIIIEKLRLLEA